MITVKFQAIDDNTLSDVDRQAVMSVLASLEDKYPSLLADEEIVADVRLGVDPATLEHSISVVTYIPKHKKLVVETVQQTFDQALSAVKQQFDRSLQDLTRF